jgi:hypothetical protein
MTIKKPNQQKGLKLETDPQMELFYWTGASDETSGSIAIYDTINKYVYGRKGERFAKDIGERIERTYRLANDSFQVVITPARLRHKVKGVETVSLVYPSEREEIVEEALRKLCSSGGGTWIDEEAGLFFTLGQVQSELERHGHGYNKREIREALEILADSKLEIYSTDGEMKWISAYFPGLRLTTRDDYLKAGKNALCFVKFHSLVTRSIRKINYRQYNYDRFMRLPNAIARSIYKRLVHAFTYAATGQSYHFKMLDMLNNAGHTPSARIRQDRAKLDSALESLMAEQVLLHFDSSPIKDGRTVVDFKYVVEACPEFISEQIRANKLIKDNRLSVDAAF